MTLMSLGTNGLGGALDLGGSRQGGGTSPRRQVAACGAGALVGESVCSRGPSRRTAPPRTTQRAHKRCRARQCALGVCCGAQ